ncbi:ABC transporter permease [Oleiharenicola sp. Vm1]|uniref:ABC transporter permease n=1 Tax=Oleiharenicola sp. Vm1 TaxID=3398393 RepID=UPI0039F63845
MSSLLSVNSLRQTLRRLARERGFTATVVLTLALCIGANVAIFAVVDAVLVRALPFPEPAGLVTAINAYPGAGVDRAGASLPNYYDRKAAIKAFASTAIFQGGSATVGDAGSPQRVDRARVSPEFFATLGVPLAMGRTFTEEEMFYKAANVAILTDGYWRAHFHADPAVLGKTFTVDSQPVTVIGVLPPGFRYLSEKAQFFIPAASNPDDRKPDRRHSNNFSLIARLAPGATLATAQAQIDAFNAEQIKDDPFANLIKGAGYRTNVFSLHADHVREVRPILLILQGGVLFLLLIGGVNLVNLLLIRASGRAKEIAVRQALGASRRDIANGVVLETVLLALIGGALGLAIGAAGVRLLAALGTDQMPLGATIAFDGRVALVALAGAVVVGLALAVPVIWFNSHTRLAPVLQAESRGGTVTRSTQRLRHAFIVTQVGLAYVLLAGAGLLGLSLERVLATKPGFNADQVLTGQIALPWKNYPENKPRLAFVERLLSELRAQPGVVAVGLNTNLPMTGDTNDNAIAVEGIELKPGDTIRAHYTSGATADYWKALNIPLLEGRLLEDADNHREQRVCVVDQDFARRYWPGQSALGRRLVNGPTFAEKEAFTIVGVVGSVKQTNLAETTAQGAIYFPYQHYAAMNFYLVIRSTLPAATLAPMLQKTVLSIDPALPVNDIKSMQAWVDGSVVVRRSPAVLAAIFAAVALLLAAIGTYGVLAYAVSQRRREIGVRMALGARPGQVLGQFLGLGVRLLGAGTALGLVGAWAVGRAMKSQLFGVDALHFGVLGATAAVLLLVVLAATFLPSHRASRVSPIDALRDD